MYKSNGKKAVATTTKYTAIIAIQSRKKKIHNSYMYQGVSSVLYLLNHRSQHASDAQQVCSK